jgi:arylsulfatase A-like enzyme
VLEGGIRVPTIVRWDGKLPHGKVVNTTAISFDLTATALQAGGALPKTGLDGVDLVPFLAGKKTGAAHPALFWRSGSQGAVRSGDWKLVRTGEKVRLFNLRTDIGERNDLAATQPKKAAALNAQWRAWSARMQPPAWVRNELSGGDPPSEGRVETAIDRFVRGERSDLTIPE